MLEQLMKEAKATALVTINSMLGDIEWAKMELKIRRKRIFDWKYIIRKIQIEYKLFKMWITLKSMLRQDIITKQDYKKLETKRKNI